MTQQNNIPTPENMEDCLAIQAYFVGIPKITKNNYEVFFERGKALQLLGVGFLTKAVDSSLKEDEARMPTLSEVKENIGLSWEDEKTLVRLDDKGWKNAVYQMVSMQTKTLIQREGEVSNENGGKQT